MRTLELMERSTVLFTDGEKNTFSRMDDFGVPISNLKQIIDMKASDRSRQNSLVFLQIRQSIERLDL
jgi:hypothetical protein